MSRIVYLFVILCMGITRFPAADRSTPIPSGEPEIHTDPVVIDGDEAEV